MRYITYILGPPSRHNLTNESWRRRIAWQCLKYAAADSTDVATSTAASNEISGAGAQRRWAGMWADAAPNELSERECAAAGPNAAAAAAAVRKYATWERAPEPWPA